MHKYAVAILSFFDNDNKLFVVEAETEQEAAIKAIIKFMEADNEEKSTKEWIEQMRSNTIEEIQEELFNADMSLSNVVEV